MNLKCIWISAGGLALLLMGCSSGFTNIESVEQRRYIAVYTLNADQYPDAEDIKGAISPTKKMPALTPEQIRRVFGALKFRRKSIWGTQTRPVFYKEELAEIAPTLSQSIAKMKANQRMVFITRYDPDQSVTSRMERVTAMMWADGAGLNLILGEIRHEIPLNDFLEQDEWTEILPISMRRSFPYYSLVSSPDYELKKINGFTHGTWIIYDPNNLDSIREKKSRVMSLDEKEKLLRRAMDNRIISRKEFDAKRKLIEQERKARLLREALDAGLVSPREYDRKLRDIYKGGEPPREFLRRKPVKKITPRPFEPTPGTGDADKKKPLIIDKKDPEKKTDEKKADEKKIDEPKTEIKKTEEAPKVKTEIKIDTGDKTDTKADDKKVPAKEEKKEES